MRFLLKKLLELREPWQAQSFSRIVDEMIETQSKDCFAREYKLLLMSRVVTTDLPKFLKINENVIFCLFSSHQDGLKLNSCSEVRLDTSREDYFEQAIRDTLSQRHMQIQHLKNVLIELRTDQH